MNGFQTLSLPLALSRALEVLGFAEMTPVQAHALPPILEGKDVTAQARTGSGKTVAFGLGALSAVAVDQQRVQVLALCPTRELAEQVSAELRRLARFIPNLKVVTLCGGVPCREQAPSLQQPPQVVVGTPGRILDHLQRENLDLRSLKVLVLDEADRMLDMGFIEAISEIEAQTARQKQVLLFSATFSTEIRQLSERLQRTPVQVTVDATHSAEEIEQTFYEVAPDQKLDALRQLLQLHHPASALVFCHTKKDCRDVARQLRELGHSVLALHGDLEQRERDEVLVRFVNQSCSLLVATDVAARGLDIKGLPAVISWELPTDPDLHVHRVGRTGRAGEKGLALSLCTRRERERAEAIESRQGQPLRWGSLTPSPTLDRPAPAPMVTVMIEGGRQDKLRPGDVLGALTGEVGLPGEAIGKIDLFPTRTYVAVRRGSADRAVAGLRDGKIKKAFRVRALT